jgi:hypothetical protein
MQLYGQLHLGQADALGQSDAEALEERALRRVGLRHTPQANLGACLGRQDHVVSLNTREFLQHRAW